MRQTLIILKKLLQQGNDWALSHQLQLTIFNLVIILLFVLRSAGYFEPFFPLTVNFIVFFGLFMSIFLLESRSKQFFVVAIMFWSFAAMLRIVDINVWAERTAVYAYQSFFLAMVLFIFENIKRKKARNIKT